MPCARCLLRECLCGDIPRIDTHMRIVIVRHTAERWRSSNTGRIAALALANSEIIEHGGELVVPASLGDAALVFPEGAPSSLPPPVSRLVFLDATWQQARRMRQRLPALRGMPIWHLPVEHVPAARLRESPGAGRVSTIEAIAHALRLAESEEAAAALERLFALHVERAKRSSRSA